MAPLFGSVIVTFIDSGDTNGIAPFIGFDETPDAVLHKEILQTVQSLPDWAADVLLLSAVYGCSTRELASVLGITIEAAKKRLQRARVLFRNKMKEGETR